MPPQWGGVCPIHSEYTMQTQAQIYRSARHQHPALPALSAWQHAGQKLEVDRWIARVGFAWNDAIAPRYPR